MPNEMRVRYERFSDALYIKIKEGEVADSEEIAPGIIVDYDINGDIIGVEILWFSKRRIDLNKLVTEGLEAVVAEI
ncbi:MAG: DUF2283 domain-containing protein [Sulfolobales archaeon]